jgi:tRNA nucleotidyltransferase (CCA-adding enzyme)
VQELISRFTELDHHLLQDGKPSEYLTAIVREQWFQSVHPFAMLADLVETPQSLQHHPEGSVWNHTLLVLDNAAARKQYSRDPRVFVWAALLHDIGKAPTTKVRKGKITSYDHDDVGAKMVVDFMKPFMDDMEFITKVSRLVRWHMQILFVVKGLPFAHIRQMASEVPIEEVALFGLCDRLGRGELTDRKVAEEKESVGLFVKKCEEVLGRSIEFEI